MDLNHVADYGQTKAEAAMGASCRNVGLPEALEYIRKEFRTDALTGVCYDDLNARFEPSRSDFDASGRGSELDRIGQQIPDHLLQPFRITRDCSFSSIHVNDKGDVFRVCGRPHHIDGTADDLRWFDVPEIQTQLARDDAGYIEEIIDELALRPALAQNGLQAAQLVAFRYLAFQKDVDPARNRGQRSAQLV